MKQLKTMQDDYQAYRHEANPNKQVVVKYQQLIKTEKAYFIAKNTKTLAELTLSDKEVTEAEKQTLQEHTNALTALAQTVVHEKGIIYNRSQLAEFNAKIEAVKKRYDEKLEAIAKQEDEDKADSEAGLDDDASSQTPEEVRADQDPSLAATQDTTPASNYSADNSYAGSTGITQNRWANRYSRWSLSRKNNSGTSSSQLNTGNAAPGSSTNTWSLAGSDNGQSANTDTEISPDSSEVNSTDSVEQSVSEY